MIGTLVLGDIGIDLDALIRAVCKAGGQDLRSVESITIRLAQQPASVDHLVDTPPVVRSVEWTLVQP